MHAKENQTEDQEAQEEELPRVTVTGQPLPNLIDGINRSQARDVREIFSELANVDIGGGTRVGQRIYLRGIETTNLNISIDGARQGQNLHNHRGGLANIDPAILRAVEVQPGPAAADQGHGALGGSIRFETIDAQDGLQPGQKVGGFLRTSFASADDTWRNVGAAYAAPTEQIGLLAFHSRSHFDDLRIGGGETVPFSGGRDQTELLRLSLVDFGAHSLRVGAERNRGTGLNFFQRADYPWQLQPEDVRARPPRRQSLKREQMTSEYRFEPAAKVWDITLKLYDRLDELDVLDGPLFRTETSGFDLRNVASVEGNGWTTDLTVGLDYFEQDGTNISGSRGPRRNSYDNLGLFVQNRMTIGLAALSFGVRHDSFETRIRDASSDNNKTLFNAGIDLKWTEDFETFIGFGESARGAGTVPIHFAGNAVENVLFNGQIDGELKAETSEAIEVGLSWKGQGLWSDEDRFSTRLTAFQTRIDNPIVYEQPGSGGLGRRPVTEFRNADESITFEGLEFEASYDLGRFDASLTLARIRTIDLPNQAQFLVRFGAPTGNRGVLNLGYQILDSLNLSYTLTGVRRLDEIQSGQSVFSPKAGYSTHDIYLNWQPPAWPDATISFAVRNLLDREYAAHSTFTQNGFATQESGRDVRLTLGYTF
ncbi:MAG: TonB-dependent receptor [Wenzhouxiangella sp.]|nr:TonB-dependent receptor [Wenzhouxiangella sp.]